MVSQTEQKSSNPWIHVLCALTLLNPGYGQADRAEVNKPMDQHTDPWVGELLLCLPDHIQG
jgi:hypothetical protein